MGGVRSANVGQGRSSPASQGRCIAASGTEAVRRVSNGGAGCPEYELLLSYNESIEGNSGG